MMDEEREEALLHLQLHRITPSPSSCTRAVETELSMSDITRLHQQLAELRELVAALENVLQQQKVGEISRISALLLIRNGAGLWTHWWV